MKPDILLLQYLVEFFVESDTLQTKFVDSNKTPN
jgi:hypothetical protein